jgi:hypothetical protein
LAIVSDTEKSPLLRNIDVAFGELRDTGNYRSSDEEALAAKNHLEVILVVPMSKLRLLGTEREFRYLPIRTSDGFIRVSHDGEPERYEAPTNEEQEVKDIFGYTLENLTMLKNSPQKIKETRIGLSILAMFKKKQEKFLDEVHYGGPLGFMTSATTLAPMLLVVASAIAAPCAGYVRASASQLAS